MENLSASGMSPELHQRYQALQATLEGLDTALIAFSGGIDSSLVAYVAGQVLGTRALAVTSGSAALKRSDLKLTQELAESWGLRHQIIITDELSKPDYRANPVNRCFHCKTSLYEALQEMAEQEQITTLLNGTNLDDLGDHRPGLIAADNFSVRSPLVEAGFHKSDIRALANHLGLENANKPQSACLSSRFPYGTAIDEAKLAQVEGAEALLASLGFIQYRVRHHGEVARIEVDPEQLSLAVQNNELLNREFKALGYSFVTLDLQGFRSGALNETLSSKQVQVQRAATDLLDVVQLHDPQA
jgi:uncharacterized protein